MFEISDENIITMVCKLCSKLTIKKPKCGFYYQEFQESFSICNKGPYIKYIGGGDRMVFAGAMKSFKHILMDHEIFLKIFDGQRNIFLCSPLVILIFKLKESERKMSKLAIMEI